MIRNLLHNKIGPVILGTITLLLLAHQGLSQKRRSLSLQDLKQEVLLHNQLIAIKQDAIEQDRAKTKQTRASLSPMLMASGTYLYNGITQSKAIPAGAFGSLAGIALPETSVPLVSTTHNMWTAGLIGYQPISELSKIHSAIDINTIDEEISRLEVTRVRNEVLANLEKLYYALLNEQKLLDINALEQQLTELKIYDVESGLQAGQTDKVNKIALEALLSSQKEKAIELQDSIADFKSNMIVLMGSSEDEDDFTVIDSADDTELLLPLNTYLESCKLQNPDLQVDQKQIEKASKAIEAVKKDQRPDFGILAGYSYQNIINNTKHFNYYLGATVRWNFWDFGKRNAQIQQHQAEQHQAAILKDLTENDLKNRIKKDYRKVKEYLALMTVTKQEIAFREEAYRMKKDQTEAGLTDKKSFIEVALALEQAKQHLYSARIGYHAAMTDLKYICGIL